ncbi:MULTISPECIES: (deoxy)nucleoside triphosphate pyrophosphohydrolase [unclassified Sporosarcina]|uniref:(deoxy)nucleoside triphosphate pyrophosphohydrolase n=1 Tax=unclassified Sporosarcina TaxID=2647733 RepID=UPI00057B54CF|nr:(deoxy)nucleoside triphosphate pyrophosphohydrolase [Sporosarcina sp. ZBG7A]
MNSHLHVAGAVIHNDDGEILCAQRSENMTLSGYWEFPGGKIEKGETPQGALVREIKEELCCEITVGSFVENTIYDYDSVSICLKTYYAEIQNGTVTAQEHSELKWVPWHDLLTLQWAPADIPAVERVMQQCKKVYMNR